MIGKEVAINSMDFKKAQLRLYELMEEWLIALLTKIIEKNKCFKTNFLTEKAVRVFSRAAVYFINKKER